MISFIVRMRFAPEDRAAIDECLRKLTAASREELGCLTYVPHWVEGEPACVLIYEQYRDASALDFHRETEHFAQYATGILYQKMHERQMEHLSAIA